MTVWLWIGFVIIVLGMLALDLGVFHRRSHTVSVSEAAIWTTVWIALSFVFTGAVYFLYEHRIFGIGTAVGAAHSGEDAAVQYFTGYIIEKSLSLDNIFVIAMIFSYFRVRPEHQHRVLFWGILGALIMRGLMIAAGAALIHRFSWIIYVFGALLIFTALKMLFTKHENIDPEKNPLLRLARRLFPVSPAFEGQKFFTYVDGRRAITPLFLVLLVVESTDVLFAVDSIPAIFAVTQDSFLVFTSNVFAILGLRSLYFVLAGVMDKFRYLKFSLVVVLGYVGVKMILSHHYPIPTLLSLGIIGGALLIGVIASMIVSRYETAKAAASSGTEDATTTYSVADYSWRQIRRVLLVLAGTVVLLVGIALLVLPGPGLVVILAGLAILGTEFVWARHLLKKAKKTGKGVWQRVTGNPDSKSPDAHVATRQSDST